MSTTRAVEFEKILIDNHWSQADLARYLGVSRAWVTILMQEVK
jgi:DNA-binding Xre family transcriptional regulator